MTSSRRELRNVADKLAILHNKLTEGADVLLRQCLETLEKALLQRAGSDVATFAQTALVDIFRAVDPLSLPKEISVTPYTLVELLLPEMETSPEEKYRQIRLASIAIQLISMGKFREQISAKDIRVLMRQLVASIMAEPSICKNENLVTELLWVFIAKPLLKAADRSDTLVATTAYTAVCELLKACNKVNGLACKGLLTNCCKEILKQSVYHHQSVLDLLDQALPKAHVDLDLFELAAIIEGCVEAASCPENYIEVQLQAMINIIHMNNIAKSALERHIANPSTHHLPRIMWAVLMAPNLPERLEKLANADNDYLAKAADLCKKTAMQLQDIYEAFNTEEQKTIHSRKLALKFEKEDSERRAMAKAAAVQVKKEIEPLKEQDEKVELPTRSRTETAKEIQPLQDPVCGLDSPLQNASPTAEDTYPASVKTLPFIKPTVANPSKSYSPLEEGMIWCRQEYSKAEKIKPTSNPYYSPLEEGMKHWSSAKSILIEPEATYPTKPYQTDHSTSPLEAGMGDWSCRASEFSDTNSTILSSTGHDASYISASEADFNHMPQESSASDAFSTVHMYESASEDQCDAQHMDDSAPEDDYSSMARNISTCNSSGSICNECITDSHSIPSGMNKGLTDGASTGKDSVVTSSFDNSSAAPADSEGLEKMIKKLTEKPNAYRYDSLNNLAMHEVYPGIVVGKKDNLKHTDLLEEWCISHVISFEDLLSSASLDRLLLGKADFHEREWLQLETAIVEFSDLFQCARQCGGRLMVVQDPMSYFLTFALLVFEENRSPHDILAAVEKLRAYSDSPCVHSNLLNLLFAWKAKANKRRQTKSKAAEQSCKPSTTQQPRQDCAAQQAWQSSYAFSNNDNVRKGGNLKDRLKQQKDSKQKTTTATPEPGAFNAREAFRAAF